MRITDKKKANLEMGMALSSLTLNGHNTIPKFLTPDFALGCLRAERQWTIDPKIPPCRRTQELPQVPGHVPAWIARVGRI